MCIPFKKLLPKLHGAHSICFFSGVWQSGLCVDRVGLLECCADVSQYFFSPSPLLGSCRVTLGRGGISNHVGIVPGAVLFLDRTGLIFAARRGHGWSPEVILPPQVIAAGQRVEEAGQGRWDSGAEGGAGHGERKGKGVYSLVVEYCGRGSGWLTPLLSILHMNLLLLSWTLFFMNIVAVTVFLSHYCFP